MIKISVIFKNLKRTVQKTYKYYEISRITHYYIEDLLNYYPETKSFRRRHGILMQIRDFYNNNNNNNLKPARLWNRKWVNRP
jgi:hypothetical protein